MLIIKEKTTIKESHNMGTLTDAVVRAVCNNFGARKLQVELWSNKLKRDLTGKIYDAIADMNSRDSAYIKILGVLTIEIFQGEFRILSPTDMNLVETHKIKSFSADQACVWISCTDGAYLKIYSR